MATTMPMLAPDGTSGDIPVSSASQAMAAGFRPATEMTSPDGNTGYIPRENVAAAMQSGFKPTPSQVKQPGFFSTLADSLGVGPKSIQAAQEDQQAHPIRSAVEKYVPGAQLMPFARGAANQVADTAGELWQAGKSLINGNPPEAALHGINSIPLVGRNIVQAGENLPPIQNGSYGDYLNETLKSPNAWGTAVSTAAQVAPLVLGAVDKAAPGRSVIPNPPVVEAIQTAAAGNPDAAVLRGLQVGPKSPKAMSVLSAADNAKPFLQGAQNLEDLQGRIAPVKAEIWKPYQQAVDAIGDRQVMGPDGPTTVSALEDQRLQLSALNRGLKQQLPEAIQVAQQKGMTAAQLLDQERAVKAALDPELESTGINPQLIRKVFGSVSQIGQRVSGKTTLIEPTQPSGFGKIANLSIKQPLQAPAQIASGLRDLLAGRPLYAAKPTDLGIREGFANAGPKPDFGVPRSSFIRGLLTGGTQ